MSEDTFKEIKTLLEDIKALLLFSNQDKLEETKKKLLKAGSIESHACIHAYTRAVISTLRLKGLVRTIEREGKKVHEQRF